MNGQVGLNLEEQAQIGLEMQKNGVCNNVPDVIYICNIYIVITIYIICIPTMDNFYLFLHK